MAPPVLGIVNPQEWLNRTSLALRSRGASLIKVDDAYAKYFRERSEGNKQALYQTLHSYLIEKGGNWENASRNKSSGGLMAYIYNSCKPPQATNVLEKRVPESRHGVLYLWQHTRVESQLAKIALEGALGIGGSAFSVFQGTNYQADDKWRNLGVINKDSNLNKIGTGLTAGKLVGKAVAPKGKAEANASFFVEPHPAFIKLSELRDDPSILQYAKHWLGDKFNNIYDLIKTKINKIWEDFQLKWYSGQMWGTIGVGVTTLVNFVLGKIVAHAAPFAASGISIAQGLAKAFAASIDRVSAAFKRSKFIVSPGHPELIANSIERQLTWEIGKGVYNMAKGGIQLTGDIFSLGATALINLIAACVEFVYNICTRIYQSYKMNAWLQKVNAATGNRNSWKADPADGKWRPPIVFKDQEFRSLFQEGCDASVCIPMMTLNSGIAGDLMMFMKMFDDTGSILGQSTGGSLQGPTASAQKKFDAGNAYWSVLKQKSRDYLESTGFTFRSSDKVAQGLMCHAIEHHQGIASTTDRMLSFAAG